MLCALANRQYCSVRRLLYLSLLSCNFRKARLIIIFIDEFYFAVMMIAIMYDVRDYD